VGIKTGKGETAPFDGVGNATLLFRWKDGLKSGYGHYHADDAVAGWDHIVDEPSKAKLRLTIE